MTLSGTRWRGDPGADVAVGRLDANLAIFDCPRVLVDEYEEVLTLVIFDAPSNEIARGAVMSSANRRRLQTCRRAQALAHQGSALGGTFACVARRPV